MILLRGLSDPMSELQIKYNRSSIKSVLLKLDNQVLGSEVEFSLQHLTVSDFFDRNGDFCSGEELIRADRSDTPNSLLFLKKVFSQIEEFDSLRLVLFVDKNKYQSWDFAWPDNAGQTFLTISLSAFDPPPPPMDDPIDVAPEPIAADPKPPIDTGQTPPEDTERPIFYTPVPPTPHGEKLTKFWMIFGICCVFAIAAYGFRNEIVSSIKKVMATDDYCSSSEQLEVTLLDETSWPEYVEKCKDSISKISHEIFESRVTQLLEGSSQNSGQFFLNAAKLNDPTGDQNLLKMLRPDAEPNMQLAIRYYSIARDQNASGAEALLRAACQSSKNDLVVQNAVAQNECKGFYND